MYINGWRFLNVWDVKSYEKKKIFYIYIYFVVFCGFVELFVGGSECFRILGINFYWDK